MRKHTKLCNNSRQLKRWQIFSRARPEKLRIHNQSIRYRQTRIKVQRTRQPKPSAKHTHTNTPYDHIQPRLRTICHGYNVIFSIRLPRVSCAHTHLSPLFAISFYTFQNLKKAIMVFSAHTFYDYYYYCSYSYALALAQCATLFTCTHKARRNKKKRLYFMQICSVLDCNIELLLSFIKKILLYMRLGLVGCGCLASYIALIHQHTVFPLYLRHSLNICVINAFSHFALAFACTIFLCFPISWSGRVDWWSKRRKPLTMAMSFL